MTRDDFLAIALIASFALFVTVHVVLVAGLATHPPRWRALVALVAFPLAPYLGVRTGRSGKAALWVAAALAYGGLLMLASR